MIVVDLETIAVSDVEIEPVAAPSNYTKQEAIDAYVEKAHRAQRDKAGLYPWTARIIALGYCFAGDDLPTVRVVNSEGAEADMLRDFWARISDEPTGSVSSLVTFNGLGFDLPVLMARSRLLGVSAPTLNLDRYRSPHPDLMQILTFRGAIPARSLTWFAKRFGLPVDDAFSGKEIPVLFEDQNWDAIRSHCASDVVLTRMLAERMGVMRPVKKAA